MATIKLIFGFYDQVLSSLPTHLKALISLGILLFFIWLVYIFVKNKSWIILILIILLIPGTWPAAKTIGLVIWTIFSQLALRINGL